MNPNGEVVQENYNGISTVNGHSYANIKTKNTNFVGSIFEIMFRAYKDRHVKNGIAMHDGTAVAYMTNPELFKVEPVHTEIEYFDSVDTGVITMDFKKKPNAITCTEINIKKFKKLYFDLLKKCK
jgi:inosine-uridine nucleoside N-ribohydrolase